LLADVWALEKKGHTARTACRIILSAQNNFKHYKTQRGKKISLSSLYRRYQEAINRSGPIMSQLITKKLRDGAPVKDWVISGWASDEDARAAADARWAACIAKLSNQT
jgi:hypothetical protein